MNLQKHGYLQLVYYALFNGFVGVLVKEVHGLDTFSIVFFRGLIAAAFIGLIATAFGQGYTLRLSDLRATLLVGLLQGLMTILIIGALRMTAVANALFLLYTAPVFAVLMARLFLKEQITAVTWLGIGIVLVGVLLIVNPANLALDKTQALGSLMALGAGVASAAMTVAAKPLTQKVSGYYIVFWQYLLIALLTLPFVHPAALVTATANWWQLGGLGIVCTGIAYTLYMRGVRAVPAQHVLIVSSLEPLAGTVIAGVLLHEALSPLTLVGAVLIMAGAYRVAKVRTTPPAPQEKQLPARLVLATS